MDEENLARMLSPFSDLKDMNNTIYDNMPYKKNLELIGLDGVKLTSGNVVYRFQLVPEDTVQIDSNNLLETIIEDQMMLAATESYYEEEFEGDDESATDAESGEEVPTETVEPVNAFADVDDDGDDFSFLR